MKTCRKCGEVKSTAEFYDTTFVRQDGTRTKEAVCKVCSITRITHARRLEPGRARLASSRCHARKKGGVPCSATPEEINSAFSEQCAICGVTERISVMDHCHVTGKLRGFLCNSCSRGLGYFRDSPKLLRLAAIYLEGIE
jgi:hypothetical protein